MKKTKTIGYCGRADRRLKAHMKKQNLKGWTIESCKTPFGKERLAPYNTRIQKALEKRFGKVINYDDTFERDGLIDNVSFYQKIIGICKKCNGAIIVGELSHPDGEMKKKIRDWLLIRKL